MTFRKAQNAVLSAVQGAAAQVAAVAIQGRIEAFFRQSAGKYTVNGVEVAVMPFFRMPNGPSGPAKDKMAKVYAVTGYRSAEFDKAVGRCTYGRCTPEQLQMVTQALIDAGELEKVRQKYDAMPHDQFVKHGLVSRPLDDVNAIKLLQWEYGLGIDCAGYVQLAFLAVHGGSRETWGFKPIGHEALTQLKGNKAFERAATPVNARPGDLIILRPPVGEREGHTVLVRDRRVLTDEETKNLSGAGPFMQPSHKVHVIAVDASWGAGKGNLDVGGVQTRQFLYNETTGKWADIEGDRMTPQPIGPYHGHPVEGIYHPKAAS